MKLTSTPTLAILALGLFAQQAQACSPMGQVSEPALSPPSRERLPPSLFAAPPSRESENETRTSATLPSLDPPAPAEPPPAWPKTSRSEPILNGFWNPMPGGVLAGYRADTGLDIMGIKKPVFALASGQVDYAEQGHTLWTGPRDTALCIRIELDEAIDYKGKKVTHIYYAHLSELVSTQPEGSRPRAHVDAGDRLGTSGVANGSYHLHVGFLLDGDVSQAWETYLFEDEIREVMGGYRKGARLPAQ